MPPRHARSQHATPRSPLAEVRLRTDNGEELRVPMGARLQRAAMAWSYVVRNRKRWLLVGGGDDRQPDRARRQLQSLGLTEAGLRALDAARLIEVAVPYQGEAVGWEGRVLPWESLLSAATRGHRQAPLLVVRCLETPRRAQSALAPATHPLLIVLSTPGPLDDALDLELERRLVESSLRARRAELLATPDTAALASRIAELEPSLVHLAGLDAHEARRLFDLPDLAAGDGFLLAGADAEPKAVGAEELARSVGAGARKPRLLLCSFGNSAARLAPLAVAAGCGTALGFEDELDAGVMEPLLADFYAGWRLTQGDALRAFGAAFNGLRGRAELLGTGLVLWSAVPLLREGRAPSFTLPAAGQARKGSPRELIGVEARPLPRLNYALLHNGRDLFESFQIFNYSGGRLEGVAVEVVLHAGAESLAYRAQLDLEHPVTDLGGRVRIPLTSALARSLREAVHTTIHVEVSWQGERIHSETERVTLLPPDEWRDDPEGRLWLPSFVLPRDPAVEQVVTAAERYLRVLRDDAHAGFDGYQSASDAVDLQVRALWAAVALDLELAYVNPPPTYSAASQRLRTPSQLLRGRKGTCIDLALLFSACLEWVGLHPVLVLSEGHAFTGYWRTLAGHAAFEHVERPGVEGPRSESQPPGQRVAWQVESDAHPELLARVAAGDLVPLEAIPLTEHGSFAEACRAGLESLRDADGFEALLDIVLARRNGVTPVPIRAEEA